MSYKISMACAGAFAAVATLAGIGPALSHVIVGDRFFPATITIDDPGVNDELALPSFAWMTNVDGSREADFSGTYAKRITPEFGITISDTFAHVSPTGNGWKNLGTALQYQLFTNAEHEFVFTPEVIFSWGHTGNPTVGGSPFTTWEPGFLFGKGFGDLPASLNFLRPFAVTGQMGVEFSTHPIDVNGVTQDAFGNTIPSITQIPTLFHWGFSLQYSLPYMNSSVLEIQPEFFRHLIPIVEASFISPIANIGPPGNGNSHITTGTVSPGIIYAGRYFEIGVEALIPVNSHSGKHVGAVALLDFFLDDILPESLGRPLFAPEGFQAAKSSI